MTIQRLQELRKTVPRDTERVDILDITIDEFASADLRAEQYLSQIKNPYAFKHEGININIRSKPDGKLLKQAFFEYLTMQKNSS